MKKWIIVLAAVSILTFVFSGSPAQASPDLVVTNVFSDQGSAATWDYISLNFSVKNQGTAPTPSGGIFNIVAYLSTDASITPGDITRQRITHAAAYSPLERQTTIIGGSLLTR
jgi:hypothetical protein